MGLVFADQIQHADHFFLFGPEQDVKKKIMAPAASQKNLLILAHAMQFGPPRFGFIGEGVASCGPNSMRDPPVTHES